SLSNVRFDDLDVSFTLLSARGHSLPVAWIETPLQNPIAHDAGASDVQVILTPLARDAMWYKMVVVVKVPAAHYRHVESAILAPVPSSHERIPRDPPVFLRHP